MFLSEAPQIMQQIYSLKSSSAGLLLRQVSTSLAWTWLRAIWNDADYHNCGRSSSSNSLIQVVLFRQIQLIFPQTAHFCTSHHVRYSRQKSIGSLDACNTKSQQFLFSSEMPFHVIRWSHLDHSTKLLSSLMADRLVALLVYAKDTPTNNSFHSMNIALQKVHTHILSAFFSNRSA